MSRKPVSTEQEDKYPENGQKCANGTESGLGWSDGGDILRNAWEIDGEIQPWKSTVVRV